MKLLTIIVPVYNVEKYLEECLESIAKQTLNKELFEVILIDDKSTDNSILICKKYCSKYDNFKLIELSQNTICGAGIPSNIGIDQAKGRYIGFVDSDDYIHNNMFETMLNKALLENSDVVICNFNLLNEKTKSISNSYDIKEWIDINNEYNKKSSLYSIKLKSLILSPVPWRKLYKIEFINKFNIRYPEGDFYYEDNPLHWFVICQARSIGIIDETLITHRVDRPGQTTENKNNFLLSIAEHSNIIYNFLLKKNILEKYRIAFFFWFLKHVIWILPAMGKDYNKYINKSSFIFDSFSSIKISQFKKIYKLRSIDYIYYYLIKTKKIRLFIFIRNIIIYLKNMK